VLAKKSYDLFSDNPTLNKTNITLKSAYSNVIAHAYFVLNTFYCGSTYNMICYVANCHFNLLSRGAVKQMAILSTLISDMIVVVKENSPVIRPSDDVKLTSIKTANRIPFPMLKRWTRK